LQVLVVEGHLEKLRSDAGSGLSERESAMTFLGQEGRLVNLREIESINSIVCHPTRRRWH
jgi:hemolysin activation/secretion protein